MSLFIALISIFTFQAGLVAIEVGFKESPLDDKPEPLRMEHFHFPLGLWFVGILISLLFFIAEIIKHRLRKSTEEGLTQSQSEIENTKETP